MKAPIYGQLNPPQCTKFLGKPEAEVGMYEIQLKCMESRQKYQLSSNAMHVMVVEQSYWAVMLALTLHLTLGWPLGGKNVIML